MLGQKEGLTILHVAETCKGGVGSVIRQIVNEPRRSSKHVVLRPTEHPIPGIVPEVAQHTFARSGRTVGSLIRLALGIRQVVAATNPDLIHAHSSFAGLVVRLLVMFTRLRVPVIYTPHGWAFELDRKGNIRSRQYAWVERWLSAYCCAIICLSNREVELSRRAGISPTLVRLIYNCHPSRMDWKEYSNPYSDDSEYRVLFVGRFDRQKGFDILLAALDLLPKGISVNVTAIGEYVREIPPGASHMGRMTTIDWQPPEEVYRYMRHATVVVVPSRWEGFALVPLEAMWLGTPVLSSDASSLPEAVIEGVSGRLFAKDSAAELARIIGETTPQDWAGLRTSARAHCIERFSPVRMLDQTNSLYLEVCHGHSRRRRFNRR